VPEHKVSVGDNGEVLSEGIGPFLEARTFAYDILKCAFLQEPSREFIEFLIKREIVQAFPFADSHAGFSEALGRIVNYLKESEVLSVRNYDRLHWDYTRMFIGPAKLPAPPWESVYRDADHLHFSKETLDVRNAYRKYNLLPMDFGREPDDHIGLELDFMHKLCEKAKEKARASDETGLAEILKDQKAFLDEHLLRWVPDWARDVVNSAETDFYRGMALLLEAFIRLDREIIDELFAPSR
jgi:putative dimethyl sulfoxide reductase chaperone